MRNVRLCWPIRTSQNFRNEVSMPWNGDGVRGLGIPRTEQFSLLLVLVVTALVFSFLILPSKKTANTSSDSVSAMIFTSNGEVRVEGEDFVRVTHRDKNVPDHATPEDLYLVRKVEWNGTSAVFHLTGAKSQKNIEQSANVLEAESQFMYFVVCKTDSPDYRNVEDEFKEISNIGHRSNTSKSAKPAKIASQK